MAGDTEATPHPSPRTVEAAPPSFSGEDLPPTLIAPARVDPRADVSMIGRDIIGQYVIRSKLGEGGMGEVYLAEQPAIGRNVAIKVVHSSLVRSSQGEGIERFRNEAKAAARLESPNIVKIFNWGELDDGTLFMAMEFLAGDTLAAALRKAGQFSPELAVHVATQICSALTEAHGAGIVHRDLKPSNIMLIERGGDPQFAKVLDFGVAKLEGADITRSGALFGTPQYMSPEQLQAGNIDGRSDLYSLGVILYELLAGKAPFSSPNAIGFITLHLNEAPPQLPKTVPRALAAVIHRLLAKDPDERPSDAAMAADELRAALKGRAPRTSAKQRLRWLRSIATIIGTSAGITGICVLGWWLWMRQSQTEQQLADEKARSHGLETRLAEESARAVKAREEARDATREAREASEQARVERDKPIDSKIAVTIAPQTELEPQTKLLLALDQAELLQTFEGVLSGIKLPPSEVAEIQQSYRDAAAVKTPDELRVHLVNLIAVYRRVDRLKPGDHLGLPQLEQTFRSITTREPMTIDQREELLAATAGELANDPSLPVADRTYFQRLAIAGLIREYALDPRLIDRPKPSPSPTPDTVRPTGSKESNPVRVPDPELPSFDDDSAAPTSGSPDPGLDNLPGLEE